MSWVDALGYLDELYLSGELNSFHYSDAIYWIFENISYDDLTEEVC